MTATMNNKDVYLNDIIKKPTIASTYGAVNMGQALLAWITGRF
jgi:hypothetical protein